MRATPPEQALDGRVRSGGEKMQLKPTALMNVDAEVGVAKKV
jgi:hypothetical protein